MLTGGVHLYLKYYTVEFFAEASTSSVTCEMRAVYVSFFPAFLTNRTNQTINTILKAARLTGIIGIQSAISTISSVRINIQNPFKQREKVIASKKRGEGR